MSPRYVTQLKARPPTFVVWCNKGPEALRGDYLSFLHKKLRAEFNLDGVPLRLLIRSTSRKLKDRLRGIADRQVADRTVAARKGPGGTRGEGAGRKGAAPSSGAAPKPVVVRITPAATPPRGLLGHAPGEQPDDGGGGENPVPEIAAQLLAKRRAKKNKALTGGRRYRTRT